MNNQLRIDKNRIKSSIKQHTEIRKKIFIITKEVSRIPIANSLFLFKEEKNLIQSLKMPPYFLLSLGINSSNYDSILRIIVIQQRK